MFAFVWRCLALVVVLTGVARAGTPAPSVSLSAAATPSPAPSPSAAATTSSRLAGVAPADTYFGPFGMSPLSIRSTIGLLGRQFHYRTISDRDLLRKALITEDALRQWRTKYPADPWLAPTFFHLEQLYQAVQTQEARKHATAILKDVVRNYPTSREGHLSRSRLAAGFPALVPEPPLVATPAPAISAQEPTPEAPTPPATGLPPSAVPSSPSAVPSSPSAAASTRPAPSSTRTP